MHDARAALPYLAGRSDVLGYWLQRLLLMHEHRDVVVVALANKLAQIVWVVLTGVPGDEAPARAFFDLTEPASATIKANGSSK